MKKSKMEETPIKIKYFRDVLDYESLSLKNGELPNVCRVLDIHIGDKKTTLYQKEIDLLKEVLIRAGEIETVEESNWNQSDNYTSLEKKRVIKQQRGSEISKQTDTEEKYYELLNWVESKHDGESRHETALRYIKEREDAKQSCDKTKEGASK